jgi:hypothetical protein
VPDLAITKTDLDRVGVSRHAEAFEQQQKRQGQGVTGGE